MFYVYILIPLELMVNAIMLVATIFCGQWAAETIQDDRIFHSILQSHTSPNLNLTPSDLQATDVVSSS